MPWNSMETAPKDRRILAIHDPVGAEYLDTDNPSKLTPYGVYADGVYGKARPNRTVVIAQWEPPWDDSEGWEYSRVIMPGWWFEDDPSGNKEHPIYPVGWQEIPKEDGI